MGRGCCCAVNMEDEDGETAVESRQEQLNDC